MKQNFSFNHEKEDFCQSIGLNKFIGKEIEKKKIDIFTESLIKIKNKERLNKSMFLEMVINEFSYNEIAIIASNSLFNKLEENVLKNLKS